MKVNTIGLCLVVPLIAACWIPGVFAQAPVEIDWQTAWEFVEENNETLETARDEVVRSRAIVGEAWGGALPNVSFNGAFQHYFEVPSTIFHLPSSMSPTGNPLRIKTQMGSENNVSGTLSLTQPLWLAGKVGMGLDAARRVQSMSRMNVQVTREDLRVQLTQAFYGAILADQVVQVTEEALEMAENYRDQVLALYEEGMVSEYDLLRAEVQVAQQRPQILDARSARDYAYRGLKALMGFDVDTEIELNGSLELSVETLESYENAVDVALDRRIEFRMLDTQRELYNIQRRVETRNWLWPNFLLNVQWETIAQAEDLDLPKYEFLDGWGAALVLQIPLFDGFASRHRAEQAMVDMRNVTRQRVQLERGVHLQVFEARRYFEQAREELEAALESRRQSERGHNIAQLRYEEGVGTQLEVLDAQLQMNVSRLQVLTAKYDQVVAKAQFDRAMGIHFIEE